MPCCFIFTYESVTYSSLTSCSNHPPAENTLRLSLIREEVIGRDDGIPLKAGERME